MALLPLVIAPDPRLKQVSEPVTQVDNELKKFLDDMLETMYHEQGVGLAAVQVGVLKRIFIVDVSEDGENPYFMINPEITDNSDEISVYNEGCLSFPEQRLEIERPANIKVSYLDYNGKPQELLASGLLATAIQHELDHLNGVTISDYGSRLKQDMMLRKAKKIKKLLGSNS